MRAEIAARARLVGRGPHPPQTRKHFTVAASVKSGEVGHTFHQVCERHDSSSTAAALSRSIAAETSSLGLYV